MSPAWMKVTPVHEFQISKRPRVGIIYSFGSRVVGLVVFELNSVKALLGDPLDKISRLRGTKTTLTSWYRSYCQ